MTFITIYTNVFIEDFELKNFSLENSVKILWKIKLKKFLLNKHPFKKHLIEIGPKLKEKLKTILRDEHPPKL